MISADLVQQVMAHEGFRQKPYLCTAGKLTIGYGRNLDDNGITQAESLALLLNDLDECERDLQSFPWWEGLSEVRKHALLDMRFNLGPTRFRGFKKMLAALEAGNFTEAATQMRDSKWARQDVPARAEKLARMVEA
jgi:lysozyme